MTIDRTIGPAELVPSIEGTTLQHNVPEMRLVRESSAPVIGFDRKPHLPSPEACARFLAPFAARESAETLWLLPLDPVNRLTTAGPVVISRGTADSTLAHPREIFRAAIATNAAKIILAHNHPNGDLTPSRPDLSMAAKVEEAGALLSIPVMGNLILAPDGTHRTFSGDDVYQTTPDAYVPTYGDFFGPPRRPFPFEQFRPKPYLPEFG